MMKVFLITLGCDKNRVDAEEMLGILSGAGFSFCDNESEADVIIINTCCFIDAAKEESIETILSMARFKELGSCRRLIVTGCLAERYKEEIFKELPEVDAIVGVKELSAVLNAVRDDTFTMSSTYPEQPQLPSDIRRVLTTGGHYEYLKIAEGCDKRCTYCIIPRIRGWYRSRPMEELLKEAEYLADMGVKELIIVAQETTVYGLDLYGSKMLPDLLRKLCRIEGIEWIRILYTYPEEIDEELLETIASEEKIVKYIDMPIQHASDLILKMMGRRTRRADIESVIEEARRIVPDVVLRTSLISGFPGESEDDHRQLLEFIKKVRFDRLGVFTYSREEGTPAAEFAGQIPEATSIRRRGEIMALQEQISADILKTKVGRSFRVFVEGYLPSDEVYVGRTYMDTPDVDGYFYFRSDRSLMTGDFVDVACTAASQYDLYGEMINEFAE